MATKLADKLHRCSTPGKTLRAETRADAPTTISGYAAVFYREGDATTEYRLWRDCVERIKPGAFDRAIAEDDVAALFNHDPNLVLGRSSAKTLRLKVDEVGLTYEIDLADTTAARDCASFVARGDVIGSSFTFVPTKISWQDIRNADGSVTEIRWIEEVELYDVGPVTFPAYSGTSTSSRSGVAEGLTPEQARAERAHCLPSPAGNADLDRLRLLLLTCEG